MPITKTDFDAAIALAQAAAAANQTANAKRDEARDTWAELLVLIKTWGLHQDNDPAALALVEHEGSIYRVTPTGIKPLTVDTVTT